jgi:phosphoglycolate phosphatase-like HAD superfamily hydrolase
VGGADSHKGGQAGRGGIIVKLPKIIFFDFDGVIIDSAALKTRAFRELYRDQPDDVISRVIAYHKTHEGISRVVKIRYCHRHFLGIDLSDSDHQALCQKYAAIVEEKVVTCPEIIGATDFLRSFHDRIRFFVVSGTPEDELRRITMRRGLDPYFEAVYGSPKAKDVIVTEVLDTSGTSSHDCLFIGDAMTDYTAAKTTSVPFIGRAANNLDSPFPEGTTTICDLGGLAEILRRR